MRNIFFVVVSLFFLAACGGQAQKKKKEVVIDKSITEATAFNNLFLDSNKIKAYLAEHPEFNAFAEEYHNFYKSRNYEYAWFDTSGIGEQAVNFVSLLNSTMADLNDSSLYNKKLMENYNRFVNNPDGPRDREKMLQTEMALTGQFFQYVAKVYKGSDVNAEDLGWFIPRKKVDFAEVLDSTIANKGEDVDKILPRNEQYGKLQKALTKYYVIKRKADWSAIIAPKKGYKPGDNAAPLAQIKQRLQLLGDMPEGDTTGVYDDNLKTAVALYQERLGLPANGVLNSTTLEALNRPIEEHIKTLLINLERMRWMPAETDSAYILVNVPEYKLHVYEDGKKQFDMNVIVGKEGTSTVIFSGKIKHIVFSPYWNIPRSIVENEIVPGMNRNPNYLASHNMEITGYDGGLPVVRQLPGNDNALGRVKFLFPNSYSIYLHDTPNRSLFSRNERSLSHGCVRIQDPAKMASYLLRDNKDWDEQKVDSAMQLEEEKWVTLDKPVRVYIGYFTAWVDDNGKVNFRKDIYGHDEKMADKLFANNSVQSLSMAAH